MIRDSLPATGRCLDVRLATTAADIEAAQRLRWDVFYEDMGALPPKGGAGLDADPFDAICDHLLGEDRGRVVGTYRLLRQSVAARHGGFYSAQEYALGALERTARRERRELLELGRSCVAPAYRDAGTIQLLWRGIACYLADHDIGGLFGCASFPGCDPTAHAQPLSYLIDRHLAPAGIRAKALPQHHVEMAMLPVGSYDPRRAMRLLPPLIKGYLRVGALVGDGAVIDRQFNTVDVFMTIPVEAIAGRYRERFARAA
jgi:putative hemolysin